MLSDGLCHLALGSFPSTTSCPSPFCQCTLGLAFLPLNKISVHFDLSCFLCLKCLFAFSFLSFPSYLPSFLPPSLSFSFFLLSFFRSYLKCHLLFEAFPDPLRRDRHSVPPWLSICKARSPVAPCCDSLFMRLFYYSFSRPHTHTPPLMTLKGKE